MLDGALIMAGMPADEKGQYTDQIMELYHGAVEDGDEKIRISSAFMLSSKYELRGDYQKAHEMLELVPERLGIDKIFLESMRHKNRTQKKSCFRD